MNYGGEWFETIGKGEGDHELHVAMVKIMKVVKSHHKYILLIMHNYS